jgi:hypothetical protein
MLRADNGFRPLGSVANVCCGGGRWLTPDSTAIAPIRYRGSVVSAAGASSLPCFLCNRPRHGKRAALSLPRTQLRRTSSPELFEIPNCPHGENSEANYPSQHKKGLSNIACHIVLPTFVVTNPPTYFLATVLYTDIKRQCVMVGRHHSSVSTCQQLSAGVQTG